MKALAPSKGFAVYFHPNIPIVVWLENIRTLVQKFRQNDFKNLINSSNKKFYI